MSAVPLPGGSWDEAYLARELATDRPPPGLQADSRSGPPDPDPPPIEEQRELARYIVDSAGPVARLGARHLRDIPKDPPPPMLLDRLDPVGHTILYGTGGSYKGTLAASWVDRLADDGHRVLIVDYENHPDEWARRIRGDGPVLWVAPLTAAWGGERGPIWAQQADLRELAGDFGATFVVIDSSVPACAGTDALKPEAAAQYAGALEYIGLPALSLAHVTKADALAYPFGSVFWHNLARTTWSMSATAAGLVLAHRKHNNYESRGRFVVTVTWAPSGLLGEVWERGYSAVLADLIDDVLGTGPLPVAEIVARLNADQGDSTSPVKADSVRAALRRGVPDRYSITGIGEAAKWRSAR